jgi:uncharacterized protein (DUF1499 family)
MIPAVSYVDETRMKAAILRSIPRIGSSLGAGINRRSLEDLRNWTEEATKVLVF